MSFWCSITIIITATKDRTPYWLLMSQQSSTQDCFHYSCWSKVSRLCCWYCWSLLSLSSLFVVLCCHRLMSLLLFDSSVSAELDAEGFSFVVVLCPYVICHSWFLINTCSPGPSGYRTETRWRWCCPSCRCCWLLVELVPSFGAGGCPWCWCCCLVVVLVLLVVGAVGCAVRCPWPWFCFLVVSLVLVGFGGLGSVVLLSRSWCCRLPWCYLLIVVGIGAVGCRLRWCCRLLVLLIVGDLCSVVWWWCVLVLLGVGAVGAIIWWWWCCPLL